MKRCLLLLVVHASFSLLSTTALAQESDAEPPPLPAAAPSAPSSPSPSPAEASSTASAPPKEERDPDRAPRASTGFQMAIRSGVQIPFGKLAEGTKLTDFVSPQVPIHLEIGGKPIPNLFIGGYLGLAIGGAGGSFADACDRAHRTCASANIRFGVEAQFHIAPEAKINPWVGYGIGIESMGAGTDDVSFASAGFEYAHFMAGLDFRLSKGIGIGPVVDFSVGRYSTLSLKENGVSYDGDIDKTALHQWLSIGARLVVFP